MTTRSPRVSVVTAVYEPDEAFLAQAYASLCDQSTDWQWVVQCDHAQIPRDRLPPGLFKDSRVAVEANGEHLGAATTRNLALLRCRAPLVQNLDADDVLYPGAMSRLLKALDSTPDAAMAFGQAILSYDDGRRERWQPAPWTAGVLPPQTIPDQWLSTGRHHVSLAAAMWRAIHLHAFGGWAAMRTMEDVSLLLAVTNDYPTVYIDEPIYQYRVHPGQTTTPTPAHRDRARRNRTQAAARILAARHLRGNASDALKSDWTYMTPDASLPSILPMPLGESPA